MLNKRSGKLAAVLLSIVLAVSAALSACSSGKPAATGTPSDSATTPNTQATAEGSDAPSSGPKPKITFLTSNAIRNEDVTKADFNNSPLMQRLKEISGFDVNFEFLGFAEYEQELTLRFASGNLPDVIRTNSIQNQSHAGAVEQGVFTDLTELIDRYGPNLKKAIPQEVWDHPGVSLNGKIYGIPFLRPRPDTRVVYYRADWLKMAGMEVPKTLDDLLAFFEYVKVNDMNGDGDTTDEYGIAIRENLDYSAWLFGSFGVLPNSWIWQDDQYIPAMITPDTKEAIKFYKLLYDQGYINQNMFTLKGADWVSLITADGGRAAMYMHAAPDYSIFNNKLTDPEDTSKLAPMLPPTGPKGKSGIEPAASQFYFAYVIPSKVEHPEEIIKYFDWAYSSQDAWNFFHYGIEGVNFKQENGAVSFEGVAEPVNKMETIQSQVFQYLLNPMSIGYEDKEILEFSPVGSVIEDGFEKAKQSTIPNDWMFMPKLEALQLKPELTPGTASGSLFLDMFAKIVTGKEDVDTGFDNFVAEWKNRGGNDVIKEATAWYKSYYNK